MSECSSGILECWGGRGVLECKDSLMLFLDVFFYSGMSENIRKISDQMFFQFSIIYNAEKQLIVVVLQFPCCHMRRKLISSCAKA